MADRTSTYQAIKKYDAAVKVLRDLLTQSKELNEKTQALSTLIAHAQAEVNKAQKALLDTETHLCRECAKEESNGTEHTRTNDI